MKKTIIFLLIAIVMGIRAQVATITEVTQSVCPGESITVKFKWDQSPGVTDFRLDYIENNGVLAASIWSKNNSAFYSLPKFIFGQDTVYEIELSTESWYPTGLANISCSPINNFLVTLECISPVGIKELEHEQLAPIYFDLLGNRIEKRHGDLIIMQVGNKRKKVYLTE
jgi:hypothetical protein